MYKRFAHWASVSVLEYQKRGAIHFHIGISGFYPVETLRDEWQNICGSGNVDIAFQPDGRGNACTKLAQYMAKYLTKGMDEGREAGQHRYFRTQGIERHREVYYIPASVPVGEEERISFEVITTLLNSRCLSRIWSAPSGIGQSGFMCAEQST